MQEAKVASNYTGRSPHKILALGPTGAGKTSQFRTLPGRKFAYLFDANAILTLRGDPTIEYVEFLPDRQDLGVRSLAKEANKAISRVKMTSTMYDEWEVDFNERMNTGFFEPFDWLCIDSCTTFLDLIMDRVLTLNNRYGQFPNEDDWGPQMITFKNVVRAWTSLNKGIYFTGHLDTRQDRITKKVSESPMMTGRLRQQIPLMFSDIFSFESSVNSATGKVQYLMNTVNMNLQQQFHRTSIRGLGMQEDVTIEWFEVHTADDPGKRWKKGDLNLEKPISPEGQGLGGIINWWARQQAAAA